MSAPFFGTSFRLFATTQTSQLPQICVAIPPPQKKKTVKGQVAVSRSPMQRQITAERCCIPSTDWCQTEKSTGAPTARPKLHNHVSTKGWHWVAKTRLVVRPSIILKYQEISVISRFGSCINHCWNIAWLLKTEQNTPRHTKTSNILSLKQFQQFHLESRFYPMHLESRSPHPPKYRQWWECQGLTVHTVACITEYDGMTQR